MLSTKIHPTSLTIPIIQLSWDKITPIMKFILTSIAVFALLSIMSCTKTNNVKTTVYDTTTVVVRDTTYQTSPRNPIVGLWVGTFKPDGDAIDSFYFSLAINSNGMLISSDINASASSSSAGPWQLTGTAFTATLTALNGVTPESVQALTATYDSVAGTLSGNCNYTQGSGLNINFLLLRVQ
jgi:hypothetical protein